MQLLNHHTYVFYLFNQQKPKQEQIDFLSYCHLIILFGQHFTYVPHYKYNIMCIIASTMQQPNMTVDC